MPDGKYDPQCYTCKFYKPGPDRRSCTLHNFMMPRIVQFEFLCGDWRLPDHLLPDKVHWEYVPRFLESQEFRSLTPGSLYVDDHGYAPLDTFENLQHLVFDALIYDDPELGWSIYIDPDEYEYYPAHESTICISIDGAEVPFTIADATRIQVTGGHRAPGGEWIDHRETRTQRLAYSPDSPSFLYDWLDRYLDAAAIVRDHTKQEGWALKTAMIPPIFAFIDMLEKHRRYGLRINLSHYARWLRKR